MKFRNFLYRQSQKIKYHTASNDIEKRIAEINQYNEVIKVKTNCYFINSLELEIPKERFDFLFVEFTFNLLLSNARRLHGKYLIDQEALIFCFDQFRVNITSGSELFIINEIFIEKCYHFKLPNNSSCIVIDIGFNVGLATLYFSSLSYVKKVYSFEPFQPTYKSGLRNLKFNGKLLDKIITYNIGLGAKKETIKVKYDSSNKGINASLTESPVIKAHQTEQLEIRDSFEEISNIIHSEPGEQFVLKIDCEGAEYMIFESLFKTDLPKNIIAVMLEWHFNGAEKLEKALLQEDFKLISTSLNENSGIIYAFR